MSKRGSWFLVGLLALALAGSNAFWLFLLFDQAAAHTDRESACQTECTALDQALEFMVRFGDHTQAREVLRAYLAALPDDAAFEKEGATWVDSLGFTFAGDGRLREVRRAWEPSACE